MVTNIKKNIVKLICGILFLWLSSYLIYTVEAPGYCSVQRRFLQDEEFIESGIRTEVKNHKMKIDGTEASIRTFHAQHPGCCRIDRTPNSFLERRIGINSIGVYFYYDVDDNVSYKIHMDVNACGQVTSRRAMEIEKKTVSIRIE